ncbi:MAG: methyltransferase [Candidatus Woesearchaeota archaeon]|nr:methyltransferase [Candidatus Woesearchaeota archaeon]
MNKKSISYADVYEPREDSCLIRKHIRKLSKGAVLDMGTGSGILALEASKSKRAGKVYAVDLNRKAIAFALKNSKGKRIEFLYSDLFSCFKKKKILFDLIIFNPPYLPEDENEQDDLLKKALCGGKKGFETIERFMVEAGDYLKNSGKILLLFSSLTGKEKVEEIISDNLFVFRKIDEQSFDFESIFVYLIEKSPILRKISACGIKSLRKYAKGHRGLVYRGLLHEKNVIVKIANPNSEAVGRIKNEIHFLKILNKRGIGAGIIISKRDFFACEFLEGKRIIEFISSSKKDAVKKVLRKVFLELYSLDRMRLDKEEMHRPFKHIIIGKNLRVKMIDFERMHLSKSPKNVTQFCQFLSSTSISEILEKKGIFVKRSEIISILREYKKDFSKKSLEGIIRVFC